MIQLSSLMWAVAIFFAVIGFLRGWHKEVVATAGIVLALYALFQFDSILRGSLFLLVSQEQAFFLQAAIFLTIVFFTYQSSILAATRRRGDTSLQTGILGSVFGFLNGYLIAGSLWYFLDINEYPLTPFIMAPAADSPSAQALNLMPVVLLSGGVSGSGDVLTIIVIALFFVVVAL